MTLAVVDPYLLHFDDANGLLPVAADTLADLVRTLHEVEAYIPYDEFYWPKLWDQFGGPLARRLRDDRDHDCKKHLDALKRRAVPTRLAPAPEYVAADDGFSVMFGDLGHDWVQTMQAIVTACAHIEKTILLTRLIPGRNAKPSDHEDYRHLFVEKTCWELGVRRGGAVPVRVDCICTRRNANIRWTCRYADGLPAEQDGGKCPFYPPEDWRDSARRAIAHHKSRPCWRDDQSLYWAEPRAQDPSAAQDRRAYHWDVYLDENQSAMQRNWGKKTRKDAYLNVVRWRPDWASDGQGTPGDIHHPPAMKSKPGWRR